MNCWYCHKEIADGQKKINLRVGKKLKADFHDVCAKRKNSAINRVRRSLR